MKNAEYQESLSCLQRDTHGVGHSRIFCVSKFRQGQELGTNDNTVRLKSLVCPSSGGRRGMRASGVNAAAASREQ